MRTIRRVVDVLAVACIPAWLFGGWGLDARLGRITRSHSDIEFWVRRPDAARSKEVLVNAGSSALATQPPEESCEFVWDGVNFSTAYFDRRADGTFSPQGRWADWVFPPGSFIEEPGLLDGIPVPTMSVAAMLAMKEQYPTLSNAARGERRTSAIWRCSADSVLNERPHSGRGHGIHTRNRSLTVAIGVRVWSLHGRIRRRAAVHHDHHAG